MKTIISATLTHTPLQPTLVSIYELPQFLEEGVIISMLYILLSLSLCPSVSLLPHTQQQKKELQQEFLSHLTLLSCPQNNFTTQALCGICSNLHNVSWYISMYMHVDCAVTSVET